MNGVRNTRLFGKRYAGPLHVDLLSLLILTACVSGCGDQVRSPTQEQLAAFERASTVKPTIDMDRVRRAQLYTGPYRVIPGDVLEFTMPALLRAVTAAELQVAQTQSANDQPYVCRVSGQGAITLPAVGEVQVVGRPLAEIEESVALAYRRYIVLRPSIFVRVLEYRTSKVYISGAVKKPGVYTLRADQMTLVSLLAEAGGIVEKGAAVVRIVRSEDQDGPAGNQGPRGADTPGLASPDAADAGQNHDAAIVLPVAGMNTPFRDMALEEGDTVVVEGIQVPWFSVLGLVKRPGNFPYPPTETYNLAQAIAFAEGLDPVADPRYATIYRLGEGGRILRVPVRLVQDDALTDRLNMLIRPGDVVAVEHTSRTRMNVAIQNLLQINVGAYITGNDIWDDD